MELLKFREHTYLQKLRVLEKYAYVHKIMHTHYKNVVYIDTHAGTGKIVIETDRGYYEADGSPLIMAKTGVECYFIELDYKYYRTLKVNAKRYSNVTVIHGDCNKEVPRLLEMLREKYGYNKYVFLFIDPYSIVDERSGKLEFKWRTLEIIAEYRTEILFTFPAKVLLRMLGIVRSTSDARKKILEDLCTYLGVNIDKLLWLMRKLSSIEDVYERWKYLAKYLCKRLRDLNYPYTGAYLVYERIRRGYSRLYWMLHATRNKTAGEIMRGIFVKLALGKTKYAKYYPLEEYIVDAEDSIRILRQRRMTFYLK